MNRVSAGAKLDVGDGQQIRDDVRKLASTARREVDCELSLMRVRRSSSSSGNGDTSGIDSTGSWATRDNCSPMPSSVARSSLSSSRSISAAR